MKQGDTNSDMRWSRLTLRAQVTIVVFAGFFVVELLSVVVDIAQIHQLKSIYTRILSDYFA